MEPAVGVKLAGVLIQVTSLDDLEDVNFRLQGEGHDRFVACPVPHSRRNSGSRSKVLFRLRLVVIEAAVA